MTDGNVPEGYLNSEIILQAHCKKIINITNINIIHKSSNC